MCVRSARAARGESEFPLTTNSSPCHVIWSEGSRDHPKPEQQDSKGVRLMSCLVTMTLGVYPDNTSLLSDTLRLTPSFRADAGGFNGPE